MRKSINVASLIHSQRKFTVKKDVIFFYIWFPFSRNILLIIIIFSFSFYFKIAAKIQKEDTQRSGNKRSSEDNSEPDTKRFNSGPDYGNSGMNPALHAAQVAAQVSARLNQSNNQGNPNSSVNPEAIQKAKELISKMVNPSQASSNTPNNNNPGPNRAGLGSNTQNYTEIMIPGAKVGLVIGKGGETIKSLQEKTGAKMVVIQDGPGQEMEKPLRISGDPQKVEYAKQLVFELIQDKGNDQQPNQNQNQNRGGGGGFNSSGGMGNFNSSGDSTEIFVPKAAVGVVIGKGGDMIKKIQNETGCKLQFIQGKGDAPGDRRCIVQGSKQEVDDGKRMIEDLIESVLRRSGGGGGNQNQNSGNQSDMYFGGQNGGQNGGQQGGGVQVVHEQYQFVVPASKCGIIIGRGGDTIKQINQQSGAYCEMDRKTSANQTVEKTFTIKGEQHQVEEAKRLISEKINLEITLTHIGSTTVTQPVQSAYGQPNVAYQQAAWGGYGANQSWEQSQAAPGAAQVANQPDYSQQWIEYYR